MSTHYIQNIVPKYMHAILWIRALQTISLILSQPVVTSLII